MPYRKHVTRLRWWLSADRDGSVVLLARVRRSNIVGDETREYLYAGRQAVKHLDRLKRAGAKAGWPK